MKKPILFAAFFVLFAIPVIAQQSSTPPPPVPDYSPKIWKEYSFADDNVRFKFPVEPTRKDDTFSGDSPSHVYYRKSFMEFYLSVVTAPPNQDLESAGSIVLNAARDGAIESLKDPAAKIVKDEDAEVDGHRGKFVQVETSKGFVHRMKFFAVKNKMYIAITSVEKGKRNGFNWENDFEIPAMGFLDSIRLINK
jgi:hypothetical protein